MNKYLLIIKADVNDGDYIESSHILTNEAYNKIVPTLEKVAEALKNNKEYPNWPISEYVDGDVYETYKGILTEEEINSIEEFTPYYEYGIHSIISIDVFEIVKETKLY